MAYPSSQFIYSANRFRIQNIKEIIAKDIGDRNINDYKVISIYVNVENSSIPCFGNIANDYLDVSNSQGTLANDYKFNCYVTLLHTNYIIR